MPIVAGDIVAYGSASMPDDDTPTGIGGAIDTSIRVVFDDIVATDEIEILSSAAGDTTQDVTIYGRNAAGELVSDSATLNGTTPVTVAGTAFERILKIIVSAAHTGTVTVRDQDTDTTIAAIESGVLEIRRPFYDAAADASGGSQRDYYEKIFFKNNHGSLTLTSAVIKEQADPSTNVDFALESSLNGTDTNGAGNRQTHTGGYTFDSTDKNVANSQNLTAGSAQGCWMRLRLAAGAAAQNTSVTMRVSGNTV
jgi:hypothetical protein